MAAWKVFKKAFSRRFCDVVAHVLLQAALEARLIIVHTYIRTSHQEFPPRFFVLPDRVVCNLKTRGVHDID